MLCIFRVSPERQFTNQEKPSIRAGLSLKLVYDDDSEEELVYSEETAGLFGFEPGLDTALTEEVKEITVAYGGKSAVVFIGVESPENQDLKSRIRRIRHRKNQIQRNQTQKIQTRKWIRPVRTMVEQAVEADQIPITEAVVVIIQ